MDGSGPIGQVYTHTCIYILILLIEVLVQSWQTRREQGKRVVGAGRVDIRSCGMSRDHTFTPPFPEVSGLSHLTTRRKILGRSHLHAQRCIMCCNNALKASYCIPEYVENGTRARSGAGKCSCDETDSRTVASQMSSEPCGSRPP